jgi:SAM-dependent methyltransferase
MAMDLNPDIRRRAAADVTVLQQDCSEPWSLPDAVFTSNFLEHLPSKTAIDAVFHNAYRCLKPGGVFIVLGPNIKYVGGAYWDFYDHFVQLTERSLAEGMSRCGYQIEKHIDRFLPYTMSQGRQYPIWRLKVYLTLPMIWPLFGKQFLVVARKG